MSLPLKHCSYVKLELQERCDEGTRGLVPNSLESTKVLLCIVVESTELPSRTILEAGGLQDLLNMSLMNQAGFVIARFEASDSLTIVISRS